MEMLFVSPSHIDIGRKLVQHSIHNLGKMERLAVQPRCVKWLIVNEKNKKREEQKFFSSVPPQGVAFIASGGIVAGIFVSNSPLTDTVF